MASLGMARHGTAGHGTAYTIQKDFVVRYHTAITFVSAGTRFCFVCASALWNTPRCRHQIGALDKKNSMEKWIWFLYLLKLKIESWNSRFFLFTKFIWIAFNIQSITVLFIRSLLFCFVHVKVWKSFRLFLHCIFWWLCYTFSVMSWKKKNKKKFLCTLFCKLFTKVCHLLMQ